MFKLEGRGTRDQIANICWIIKRARDFQKNTYFCFIDYAKAFDCVDHKKMVNSSRDGNTRPPNLPLEKSACRFLKKQQLLLSQEATIRTGHGTTDWFQIGKGVIKAVYCLPAYLTYMQSTSWETLGWRKNKPESRVPGEISITSDMRMTPPLWQKWRRTKEPLGESERGEWKSWFKAQHSEN